MRGFANFINSVFIYSHSPFIALYLWSSKHSLQICFWFSQTKISVYNRQLIASTPQGTPRSCGFLLSARSFMCTAERMDEKASPCFTLVWEIVCLLCRNFHLYQFFSCNCIQILQKINVLTRRGTTLASMIKGLKLGPAVLSNPELKRSRLYFYSNFPNTSAKFLRNILRLQIFIVLKYELSQLCIFQNISWRFPSWCVAGWWWWYSRLDLTHTRDSSCHFDSSEEDTPPTRSTRGGKHAAETRYEPPELLRDKMWLRDEQLKSIWHAFTALDVDQRGKVSKSQLKVCSCLFLYIYIEFTR